MGIFISENIEEGSRINTDEWLGYKGLSKIFDHQFVKHNQKQYVIGDIYTNTMESFWALVKRSIMGIYHSMSRKHVQQYIDEFVFRFNTRKYTEAHRFNMMLNKIDGRLTYKQLLKII